MKLGKGIEVEDVLALRDHVVESKVGRNSHIVGALIVILGIPSVNDNNIVRILIGFPLVLERTWLVFFSYIHLHIVEDDLTHKHNGSVF